LYTVSKKRHTNVFDIALTIRNLKLIWHINAALNLEQNAI
jgi:hypothetical protein